MKDELFYEQTVLCQHTYRDPKLGDQVTRQKLIEEIAKDLKVCSRNVVISLIDGIVIVGGASPKGLMSVDLYRRAEAFMLEARNKSLLFGERLWEQVRMK